MKKALIIALSLATPFNICMATETAVKSTNGNISISEAKPYDLYYLSSAYGEFNFNIHKNFGGEVLASYSNPHDDGNVNLFEDEIKTTGIGLFLRDSSIGKIGWSYAYKTTDSVFKNWYSWEFDNTFLQKTTKEAKIDSDVYSLYGSFYLDNITFSANRSIESYENTVSGYFPDNDLNYVDYSFSYYPANNIRIDLSTQGMDQNEAYDIQLNYQPDLLSKHFNIFMGVRHNAHIQSGYDEDYVIGLTYFFEKDIDLKTLDRHYQ